VGGRAQSSTSDVARRQPLPTPRMSSGAPLAAPTTRYGAHDALSLDVLAAEDVRRMLPSLFHRRLLREPGAAPFFPCLCPCSAVYTKYFDIDHLQKPHAQPESKLTPSARTTRPKPCAPGRAPSTASTSAMLLGRLRSAIMPRARPTKPCRNRSASWSCNAGNASTC
jgi:hypothetical protein